MLLNRYGQALPGTILALWQRSKLKYETIPPGAFHCADRIRFL
jgi:hypothetical protein